MLSNMLADQMKRREALKIVGICVLASVVYGITHDLLSTQVCLEYFTVHHPPVFPTDDPILLAFGWGVFATWWMGLFFGVLLSACATVGPMPFLEAKRLTKPIITSMGALFLIAVTVWIAIYLFGTYGPVLANPRHPRLVLELDRRLIASAIAHLVSYTGSALIGVSLMLWALFTRWKLHRSHVTQR